MGADILGAPARALEHGPAHKALARSLNKAAKPSSLLWGGTADSARISRLFGLAIENTRLASATRDLIQAAKDGRRTRVVFVNAHVINVAMKSPRYKAALASASRVFADGSGMAIAAKLAGCPLIDNVNGTDLFPQLCQQAIEADTPIFLLGGKPGVAAAAAENIARFGWGAAIAGHHHGYFAPGSADEDRVIGMINASKAKIVLVGMGVPVQEHWCAQNASRLDAPVIAGVGGLFDFFSGAVSRAPKLLRTAGCEWMWRLAMEPRRMARRYLIGNAVFMLHALREANARGEQPVTATVAASALEHRSR